MNFVQLLNFTIKIINFFLIFFVMLNNKVNSQSTCNFLSKISKFKFTEVPFEPELRNVLYKRDANQIRYCDSPLTLNKRTCCTPKIEAEMEKISREELEINLKHQINILKEFFEFFSLIFDSKSFFY